jgi:hypothetical protein
LREAKPAKLVLDGKSESVRDVRFNPININELAAAFETGTVQVSANEYGNSIILYR